MSHQEQHLGKYPSHPNYTIINGCIALQPNAMKLERTPAGPGLEESGSWRRLPAWQQPLQSCQATSPVWSMCSVRPILQLWKLRLTRARSTPAASTIEECPEGEKLFQELTEHWDGGSITGNCHLGCQSDHPGNIQFVLTYAMSCAGNSSVIGAIASAS